AERLALDGIPVATRFDSRGHHAGYPFDLVRSGFKRLRLKYSDEEILGLYRLWMSGKKEVLPHLHLRRYSRLPAYLNRLEMLRDHLEGEMRLQLAGHRFSAIVDMQEARLALRDTHSGATLVVGLSEGGLAIAGKRLKTLWKKGGGLALLRLQDLDHV